MAEEENAAEETPPSAQSEVEEKTPLDTLLDEVDDLKARVAQLETTLASHGHTFNFDANVLNQIAETVLQRINTYIRSRRG